jgi:hypothetical protein
LYPGDGLLLRDGRCAGRNKDGYPDLLHGEPLFLDALCADNNEISAPLRAPSLIPMTTAFAMWLSSFGLRWNQDGTICRCSAKDWGQHLETGPGSRTHHLTITSIGAPP